MPRTCYACSHENVEEINEMLLRNVPYKDIAEKYGGSISSYHRHKQHMLDQMRNAPVEIPEVVEPSAVMRRIAELDQRADFLYREAVRTKDLLNAGRFLKEMREIVALYAKLTGELNTAASVVHQHVHINPEWVALRQVMLTALAPYPEARAALIKALEGAQALAGGDEVD